MKYVAKNDFKFSPNGYDIESYVAGQYFPHTGDLLDNAKRDGLVEPEKQNQNPPQKKQASNPKPKKSSSQSATK